MKFGIALLLFALAGCTHKPPPIIEPPSDAPVWQLNTEEVPVVPGPNGPMAPPPTVRAFGDK